MVYFNVHPRKKPVNVACVQDKVGLLISRLNTVTFGPRSDDDDDWNDLMKRSLQWPCPKRGGDEPRRTASSTPLLLSCHIREAIETEKVSDIHKN